MIVNQFSGVVVRTYVVSQVPVSSLTQALLISDCEEENGDFRITRIPDHGDDLRLRIYVRFELARRNSQKPLSSIPPAASSMTACAAAASLAMKR
jgi:hypothetical protein